MCCDAVTMLQSDGGVQVGGAGERNVEHGLVVVALVSSASAPGPGPPPKRNERAAAGFPFPRQDIVRSPCARPLPLPLPLSQGNYPYSVARPASRASHLAQGPSPTYTLAPTPGPTGPSPAQLLCGLATTRQPALPTAHVQLSHHPIPYSHHSTIHRILSPPRTTCQSAHFYLPPACRRAYIPRPFEHSDIPTCALLRTPTVPQPEGFAAPQVTPGAPSWSPPRAFWPGPSTTGRPSSPMPLSLWSKASADELVLERHHGGLCTGLWAAQQ
jgi:hypothetical protein